MGRPLVAALLFALATPCAAVAASPAKTECLAGQPVLQPLEPLTLVTEKGRYPFKVEVAATAATKGPAPGDGGSAAAVTAAST